MDKGRSLPRSVLFVGVILFMNSNVFGAGPYDILLVASAPSDGFVDGITGAGHTITQIQNPADLPPDLSVFAVVILADPSQALSAPQEAQIDSYVNGGGGLILFEDTVYDALFSVGAQSNPVSSWSGRSNRSGTTIVGTSTVLNGLAPNSTLQGGSTNPVLKTGAERIIDWNDGVEMAVTYMYGSGSIVYFNDHDAHFLTENWKGDTPYGTQLMLNAIDYAASGGQPVNRNILIVTNVNQYQQGFEDGITDLGHTVTRLSAMPADLYPYDVVVLCDGGPVDEEQLDKYVFYGGGLILFEDSQVDFAARCNPVADTDFHGWTVDDTNVMHESSPLVQGLASASDLRSGSLDEPILKTEAIEVIQWVEFPWTMTATLNYGLGRVAYINDPHAYRLYTWRGDPVYGKALMGKAIDYVGGVSQPYDPDLNILLVEFGSSMKPALESLGFNVDEYGCSEVLPIDLSYYDLIVLRCWQHPDPDPIDTFVSQGGGLILYEFMASGSEHDPRRFPLTAEAHPAQSIGLNDFQAGNRAEILVPLSSLVVGIYEGPEANWWQPGWGNIFDPTLKPLATAIVRHEPTPRIVVASYSHGGGSIFYINSEYAFEAADGRFDPVGNFEGFRLMMNALQTVTFGGATGCGDCNGNGYCDDDDLGYFRGMDCDGNGVLDECDIDDGTHEDENGDGVPDVCEPITLSTTRVSDRAGNVLLSFDDPDLAYKGTSADHIAQIQYIRSAGLVTQIVTTPTVGTALPRTLDVIYDENNPDRVIGTLSSGCGCSGSGDKFVYRDDRGRLEKITTAEVFPGTTDPNGTLLEQFTYEGPTDDRVKEHRRRNADGVWALFESRDHTDNPDGSYEVVIRGYVDLTNYEAQKHFYDTDGRLITLYEYNDLKTGGGDPGAPDATTQFSYVPTYEAGDLIGERRTTTYQSTYGDYKEISDWLIQGDYYQVDSTKTVTTYRENAASAQINVRTEDYEFNVALGDYRLLSVEEPSGKTITYAYDDANNHPELVLTETHSAPGGVSNCPVEVCGQATTIQYEYELVGANTTGRIQRETRPGPNQGITVVTYYNYDSYGRLTWQTENEGGSNPLARTTNYAYNAFDEQILSQDPADLVRASVYGTEGRLAEEYACEYSGPLSGFGDPGVPPPACISNAFQHTLYTYHGISGLVATRKVPLATVPFPLSIGGSGYTIAESTTEYDTTGFWRVGVTQPHVPGAPPPSTLFAYDYQGRVVKTSSAGGTLGGNPNGRVVNKTIYDGRGLAKDRIVSDNGSPTETDFLVTTTTYNGDGQPDLIVHPTGTQTKHSYDTFGRLAIQGRCDNVPNCAGVRVDTVFTYDNASRPTRQYIADIADTVTTYDTWGRSYKSRRRVTFTTSGTDDHNADQITLTEYDAAGNIAKTARKLNAQHDQIDSGVDQVTENTYNNLSEVDTLIQHNLNALGQPIEEETQFVYDTAGRRTTQIVDPAGLIITTDFQYSAVRRVTKTIDPEGHYADSEYDSRGNLIRQVNYEEPNPGERDGQGGDAKSQQRWEYNVAGRLAQLARMEDATTPAGTSPSTDSDRVTDYAYDHDGRRLTVATFNMNDATALVTNNDYDAIGRLTKTTDPAANWTENVYVLAGDPSGKPTGQLGLQKFSDIDDALRVRTVEYTYDSFARVLTQLGQGDPGSTVFTTTFEYDDADRRTKTIDPKNIATKSVFDMLGLRTQMIEDEGTVGHFNRTTAYAYDPLGRLLTLTAYDDDHGGSDQVTTYQYDLVGRRTKIFYPDEPDPAGTPVIFEYDMAGRLAKRTDQRREEVEYNYDDRGQLLERKTPPQLPDITDTYTYDGLGRMSTAQRSTASEGVVSNSAFGYNDFSDVEYEDQVLFGGPVKRLDYHYDQAGNRTAVVYPSDVAITLTYDVDALNRVENVYRKKCPGGPSECDPEQWSVPPVQVIDYDYAGLFLERRSLHTDYDWCGITVDYVPGYDGHRRMDTIHNSVRTAGYDDKVLSDYTYTLDDVGNREYLTPNVPAHPETNYFAEGLHKEIDYVYDDLYRVTTAEHKTAIDKRDEVFDYDRLSNRTKLTEVDRVPFPPDTTESFYAHNEANEYTRIGDPLPSKDNVAHDSAGNLTQDERGYTYLYDFENRLIEVQDTKLKTTLTTFTYDALGRRIRSVDSTRVPSALTLHYYYDQQNVIGEYDPDEPAPLLRYFVHGSQYIDERAILNDVATGADYYYYFRELYSVEGLVNSRGHPVEHYAYDAYGRPIIRAVQQADLDYSGYVSAFDNALLLGNWGPVQCNYLSPLCDLAGPTGDGDVRAPDLATLLGFWGPTLDDMPTSGGGIDNPYAFTGRRMDFFDFQGPTEVPQLMLYHYRAREQDPHHGRFLQRDPLEYADENNLYQYARSRPTIYLDPRGGQSIIDLGDGYTGRIDTMPRPGDQLGGHMHVYDSKGVEVAKVAENGAYAERHRGRLLNKPKDLPHKVRNKVGREMRKFSRRIGVPRPGGTPGAGPGGAAAGAAIVFLTLTSVAEAAEIPLWDRISQRKCIRCICQKTFTTNTVPSWWAFTQKEEWDISRMPLEDHGFMPVWKCRKKEWRRPEQEGAWYEVGSSVGFTVYSEERYDCYGNSKFD